MSDRPRREADAARLFIEVTPGIRRALESLAEASVALLGEIDAPPDDPDDEEEDETEGDDDWLGEPVDDSDLPLLPHPRD